MDSILTSIKKLLGLIEADTSYDTDIIIHINSAFSILNQIGAGPKEGFRITGDTETWDDFFQGKEFSIVKDFVLLKVRLLFDPPMSSTVTEVMNRQLDEFISRINIAVDPGEENA